MITSAIEHEAILESCKRIEAQMGMAVYYLSVDHSGCIDLAEWSSCMRRVKMMLVSLMLANNEIGMINRVRDVATTAHETGALFFTDMTQAVGKIPVDVRADNIDLAAFSAHKMYGPRGVGALFIRGREPIIELAPLIVGGGQERGLRSGTLNVAGIVGFGEACRIARMELNEEAERIRELRDKLEESLLTALPDIWINGDRLNRLPNTSNIMFAGVDARTLIRDMHYIAVSTRSACSSGATGPSHVLKALGLSDEQAYSSIRFSLGRFTTEEEIDKTLERVISSVRKLRSHRSSVAIQE
jgi:cysteine desulfurase